MRVPTVRYNFSSSDLMQQTLVEARDDLALSLSDAEGTASESDWVSALFEAEGRAIGIAGQVLDRGAGLDVCFAARDFERVLSFAEDLSSGELSGVPSERARTLGSADSLSVLVVDDDQDTCLVVAALLREAGYEPHVVSTAEAAFDTLRKKAIRLIVVDQELPGMTGLELCRRLRRERRAGGLLPIVFLSARSEADVIEAAFAAGADDYVCKPFRAPELSARLTSLLLQRQ